MAFERYFTSRENLESDSLFVGKNQLTISRLALKSLEGIEKANVFYDVENKAIKLVNAEVDGYKINRVAKGNAFIGIKISKKMPIGKYIRKTDDMIYIKENNIS